MSKPGYPQPFFRKLRGYAFDPSFSSTLNKRQTNEVIYKVRWEKDSKGEGVKAGPCGEYIEIIDYDPTKKCYYTALSLDDPFVLADYGMSPSEGDPRFHQQQVYAVIMVLISQFERALGRKIIWSRINETAGSSKTQYNHEFVRRLRIYPHAMRQQNAYYSPEKIALLFGYFKASNNWDGNNVPGAAIFTCLSPDIVAHETTHAILDSIHPYLTKATNLDMLAFHEGFADIIALLQRFTFRSVVEEQIRMSKGDLLSPENMLGDLAIQFGQAVSGNRRALRSFIVEADGKGGWRSRNPDPSKFHTETEPHTRGGLLVAAVFDAFTRLYKYRVADLVRIASGGTGILAEGEIEPDLVRRLSKEACEIADKLMLVCIRALDYCPPADLTFGDYLRAMVTADLVHNPDDEEGLRFALMEGFRRWGIIPDDVNTFSAESLKWKAPEEYFGENSKVGNMVEMIKYIFDPEYVNEYDAKSTYGGKTNVHQTEVLKSIERILRENDRGTIFEKSQDLCRFVHELIDQGGDLQNGTELMLGMNFQEITYPYTYMDDRGREVRKQLKARARDKYQVYKCRPVMYPEPDSGNISNTLIIMFLQKVFVDLKGSPYQGYFDDDIYHFRGGSSVIIDMSNYEIKYIIKKSVSNSDRLIRQLEYVISNMNESENNALLMQAGEPFAALHLH